MNKNEKHNIFDDQLKGRLSTYESTVPAAAWTAIQKELHPEKPARRLLIWIPIVLIGLALLGYFLTTTLDKGNVRIADENTSTELKSEHSGQDLKSTDSEDELLDTKDKSTEKGSVQQLSSDESTSGELNLSNDKNIHASRTESNTTYSPSIDIQKNNTRFGNQLAQGRENNMHKNKADSESTNSKIAPSPEMKNGDQQSSNQLPVANNELYVREKVVDNSTEVKSQTSTVIDLKNQSFFRNFDLVESISNESVLRPIRLKNDHLSALRLKAISHCEIKNNGLYAYYVELTFGPDYAHRILSLKSDEATAAFNLREDTESYLSAYHVNLEAGLLFGNGFQLSSGLNYARINEKFSYTDTNVQQDRIIKIVLSIDTVRNETGGLDSIIREVEVKVKEEGRREVEFANKLSTISVPLTLGYHFAKKRFLISAYFGAQVNIASWQEGRYVTLDGIQVLNDDSMIYKKGIGMGLIGGVGIHYSLKNGNYFTVKPNFYYSLIDIAHEDYFADQKYFKAGLQVGFRHVIARKKNNKK